MVNHILHPLGDRTLCEPEASSPFAPAISTDPASASCSECLEAREEKEHLRASLGLTPNRREEIARRALEGDGSSIALSPGEILELLEKANNAHRYGPSGHSEHRSMGPAAAPEPQAPVPDPTRSGGMIHKMKDPYRKTMASPWAAMVSFLLEQETEDGRPVLAEVLASDPDLRHRFARVLTSLPRSAHESGE